MKEEAGAGTGWILEELGLEGETVGEDATGEGVVAMGEVVFGPSNDTILGCGRWKEEKEGEDRTTRLFE